MVLSLIISIDPLVDHAQPEEWRSQHFDPISPLADGPDLDLVSKTRPRVFILFPRIVARTHGEEVESVEQLARVFCQSAGDGIDCFLGIQVVAWRNH
jgi:hypothetical protein